MNRNAIIGLSLLGLVGFYFYNKSKKKATDVAEPFEPKKDVIVPPTTTDCKILGTCVVTPKEQKGRASKRAKMLEYNGKFVTGTYPDGRIFDGVLSISIGGDGAYIVSQARNMAGASANVDDLLNVFVTTESGDKKYIYGTPYNKDSKLSAIVKSMYKAPLENRVD
jgi:hypothetical protein